MKKATNSVKCTVRICTNYVIKDPNKTKEILDRVSKIISDSYKRMQQEG
jgi:uncharacterized protein with ATP-grasp and redox domains